MDTLAYRECIGNKAYHHLAMKNPVSGAVADFLINEQENLHLQKPSELVSYVRPW